MKFSGQIFSTKSIRMNQQKFRTIFSWVQQIYLGNRRFCPTFFNFYQHFIRSFSKLSKHLNDLTKKNTSFEKKLTR